MNSANLRRESPLTVGVLLWLVIAFVCGALFATLLPPLCWGWWTIVASLNARARRRSAGWPWTLPVAVLAFVVSTIWTRIARNSMSQLEVPLVIVSVIAYIWAVWGVLFSVRGAFHPEAPLFFVT